jgi:hypothetical protein
MVNSQPVTNNDLVVVSAGFEKSIDFLPQLPEKPLTRLNWKSDDQITGFDCILPKGL